MKKLALSVAALALTAGGALAADLPSRKGPPVLPPPPPPPPMWTGFYAGLNAGYGFGTNDNTQTATVGQPVSLIGDYGEAEGFFPTSTTLGSGLALSGVGPMTQHGFIGGGQIGYNYQWGSNFVIGIEADIQGTGIRGSSNNGGIGSDAAISTIYSPDHFHQIESNAVGATAVRAGVDWMGTVRGRLGYLFTPTMLVYATGGLTYGGVYAEVNQAAYSSSLNIHYAPDGIYPYDDYGYTHSFIGSGRQSKTLVGWNVGGGLEWMFMPNWSLKAEAFYWNMGNMNVNHIATAAAPSPVFYSDPGTFDQLGGSAAAAIGTTRVNYQGVVARAGINYHFNWGAAAPVVARY